jgi:drug/metabolite transporter (DMT)-like permease
LGEVVHPAQIAGIALVLTAIVVVQMPDKNASPLKRLAPVD